MAPRPGAVNANSARGSAALPGGVLDGSHVVVMSLCRRFFGRGLRHAVFGIGGTPLPFQWQSAKMVQLRQNI